MIVRVHDNKQLVNVEFKGERTKTITQQYLTPAKADFYNIEIEIEDDQVHFDDVLFGAFQVSENMRVGIVNGNDASRNVDYVYGLDAYFQMETWNQNQVNLDASGNADLLVINHVQRIEGGLKQRVISNVNNGKSVALIPHPEADLSSWNGLLSELQMPVLQRTSGTVYINNIHSENGFFSGLFDNKNPKISIPVNRKTKLITIGSRSIPLISFSDGAPFLCKSSSAEKNIFLFNADLHKGNGNLITSDLFSALFLRIGEVSGDLKPLSYTIGESKEMRYKVDNYSSEQPVALVNDKIEYIAQQQHNNGVLKLQLSGKSEELQLQAGYYDLKSAQQRVGSAALNYPRTESELLYFEAEQMKTAMRLAGIEDFSIEQVSESYEINKVPSKLQSGLWRIFLILSIVFFLIEMALIKFWK
jgi:hypothetical protein